MGDAAAGAEATDRFYWRRQDRPLHTLSMEELVTHVRRCDASWRSCCAGDSRDGESNKEDTQSKVSAAVVRGLGISPRACNVEMWDAGAVELALGDESVLQARAARRLAAVERWRRRWWC